MEAIAIGCRYRVEATATGVEAIATRVEAVAMEGIATRVEAIATIGWRPSLQGGGHRY